MISNSGVVPSSGFSNGNAGNVVVNATESVIVSGNRPNAPRPSQISSTIAPSPFRQLLGLPAVPAGAAGTVVINTPNLVVSDQARVSVRNDGIGNGGGLTINANSISLDKRASLTASTKLGEGGNITVSSKVLKLRNGSTIRTDAAGEIGKGGEIVINAPIILGLENSDVIANSSRDRGGNITLTTQGIIGLEFRNTSTPERNATNDITASSGIGVNGSVTISIPEVDPDSGLVALPVDLVDSTQQIAKDCSANHDSSFVMTGRGGIPSNPTQPTHVAQTWNDIRDLSTFPSKTTVSLPESQSPALVEATSWHRNPQTGKVELVAARPMRSHQPMTCATPGDP